MKYCTRCLYPDTKPDLTFNLDGICSACIAYGKRKEIDWSDREHKFKLLCESSRYIASSVQPYHCIIPVSGGKDSTYQVIKALEYGLNPLCVTALTDDLSDIGNRNLHNISKLGVDHIIVSTNAKLRRRINKYTLETVGDISWAEHVTIFTIPIREAIIRKIPLIIWGENPQNEYGGPYDQSQKTIELDSNWLNEFGGLNGLRIRDIIDAGIATKDEMFQYTSPGSTYDDMTGENIKGIFLGQFFPWDGWENALIASKHGFEQTVDPVELNGTHYENLDNHQTGIHDRFKYLKFGFGRATDIACNHMRRGRMFRNDAIEFVNEYDGRIPGTYLGKKLEDVLADINMTTKEYLYIEEKFANKDLFDFSNGIANPCFEVK